MSWNIKTPGDYINGPLTVAGAATFNSDVSLNGNENYINLFSNYSVGNNSRVRFRTVGAGGGSGYGGDFRLSTRAPNNSWNTDAFIVDSSGRAGIGATSLTEWLTIKSPNLSTYISLQTSADSGVFIGNNGGALVLLAGSSERARLNTNGAFVFNGGNYSSNGVGINFPSAQSASTDANTLDDYEEGTWTPVIVGVTTAGVGTYSARVARYTKVGNMVTCHCYMDWTAHTGVGEMQLAGLPFQTSSEASSHTAVAFGYVNGINLSANNTLYGWTIPGTNSFNFNQVPTGGGSMASVPLDTSAALIFTVSYRV